MKLSQYERGMFRDAGYWVSPKILSWAEVSMATHAFDAVLVGTYDRACPPQGVERFGNAMIKVANAWWADSVIRARALDPRLGELAADLLGVPAVRLWADSLYWKAPGADGEQARIGWHQDKQYWSISSTDRMITAVIPLYVAGPESGGLRFIPGSHQWGLVGGSEALVGADNAGRHVRPPVPAGQVWREVCPTVLPGQVSFHHCLTFHGSGANRMPAPRRSLTVHYVADEGRLVNWTPVADGYLDTVGLGNPFRGRFFPRVWP